MAVIEPAGGGGSTVHITWDRRGKGVFGKLFVGLMALTRGILIRRSFEWASPGSQPPRPKGR